MWQIEYRWTDDEDAGLTWRPWHETYPDMALAIRRASALTASRIKVPGKDVVLEFRAVPHGA